MIRTLLMRVLCGAELLDRPAHRYAMLDRLAAACEQRGVTLLGFGLGHEELRLVLEGQPEEINRVAFSLRVGTSRHYAWHGKTLVWDDNLVRPVSDLWEALCWAHAAQADPLASPWTSLRDLLGYRRAPFYQASRARSRLPPDTLPPTSLTVWERRGPAPALDRLLRVAAAVIGVLPSSRTSFRLFAQLGHQLGYSAEAMAEALNLTPRRIRQLLEVHEPMVPVALVTLSDARLAVVP